MFSCGVPFYKHGHSCVEAKMVSMLADMEEHRFAESMHGVEQRAVASPWGTLSTSSERAKLCAGIASFGCIIRFEDPRDDDVEEEGADDADDGDSGILLDHGFANFTARLLSRLADVLEAMFHASCDAEVTAVVKYRALVCKELLSFGCIVKFATEKNDGVIATDGAATTATHYQRLPEKGPRSVHTSPPGKNDPRVYSGGVPRKVASLGGGDFVIGGGKQRGKGASTAHEKRRVVVPVLRVKEGESREGHDTRCLQFIAAKLWNRIHRRERDGGPPAFVVAVVIYDYERDEKGAKSSEAVVIKKMALLDLEPSTKGPYWLPRDFYADAGLCDDVQHFSFMAPTAETEEKMAARERLPGKPPLQKTVRFQGHVGSYTSRVIAMAPPATPVAGFQWKTCFEYSVAPGMVHRVPTVKSATFLEIFGFASEYLYPGDKRQNERKKRKVGEEIESSIENVCADNA